MYIHCVYVLYLGVDEDSDRLNSSLSVLLLIEEIRNNYIRPSIIDMSTLQTVLGVQESIHISPKPFE